MNNLYPKARWLFRFRSYRILIVLGVIASFIISPLFIFIGGSSGTAFLIAIIFIIVFILIFSEIYARMSYNRWLYEIENEGVKIEHGIIWKKYTSIPYERVQNVNIRRGVLARILGYSTLEIETAGASGFSGYYHGFGRSRRYQSEGHIPAVSTEAGERVREFVMKKIKTLGGDGF